MDSEKLATSILTNCISKTDLLDAFINEGDKEPSWDGNIYIYADKSKKKEGIKKVPVQVKGKKKPTVSSKRIPKYTISRTDIDNWLRDGGIMLFVVFLSENGESNGIYYRGLAPVLIKKLKEINRGKKSISIPLKEFPTDNNGKISVLLNFYDDMKKQTSFANKPLFTLDELMKSGMLESISASITTYGKQDSLDPLSAFFSRDVYLYANIKCSPVVQPLPEVPTDIHFAIDMNGEVYSGSRKLYSNYRLERYADGINVLLGKSMVLQFPASSSSGKLSFKTAEVGTLSDNIYDIECIITILENNELVVDGRKYTFTDIDKRTLDSYCKKLISYQNIMQMLESLGVKKELLLERLTDNDKTNIPHLINAVLHNQPMGFSGYTDDVVCGRITLGNLTIAIWANKEKKGYKLQSFFSNQITVLYNAEDKERKQPFRISHYSLLKKNEFIELDNMDYSKILEDISINDTSPNVINQLTLFMLEMLKAYDEQNAQDKQLLSLAEEYNTWLASVTKGETEYVTLNSLQIARRKRELNQEEIETLNELRKTGHELQIRCGANLLLGKQQSAQDCFDEMMEEDKKRFIEFPICRFGHIEYKREA